MSDIRRERDRTTGLVQGSVRRISWGAIAAGTLLALAIQFTLGLLGLGIGLSSVDPVGRGGLDAGAFASVGGLWTIAVVLIGLFVGAFAAGRFAGQTEKTDAALHGAVTWAASTLLVIYLLTSSASVVLGGAFGAIGNSIQGLAQATQALAPGAVDGLSGPLRGEAEQVLRQGRQVPPAEPDAEGETAETPPAPRGSTDVAAAIAAIMAGVSEAATAEERQAAIGTIAQEAGISEADARQRLLRFQQRYDEAARQARQAADAAASAVSAASFGAFIALLLGLVVGSLGGIAGRPRRTLV